MRKIISINFIDCEVKTERFDSGTALIIKTTNGKVIPESSPTLPFPGLTYSEIALKYYQHYVKLYPLLLEEKIIHASDRFERTIDGEKVIICTLNN